ncbi:MAG TPA: glycine cleavage system aminomethyltransferase GcvT [Candidatus Limiplasma sp.]|nr:glycine cleavage system aminomethyltransferase GcvT [Candidatus Limiplasma sp.]HPS81639.1 glycine cleavage system aminomethyltransferase GcvT [Candidatus Limiplasma sp.]
MTEPGTELKTPLYAKHVAHGGKIVPFAGYLLPVQYEAGVIREHQAVRENVGLFDVSHMGEVLFEGPDALANIQRLLCNDYATLQDGRVRYSPMLNAQGGVIDDVLVYRYAQEKYLMVVNAANRHKDVAHILAERFGQADVTDISDQLCQLALQGPKAEAVLRTLVPAEQIPQKYYSFIPEVQVGGIPVLLSRTGYTGEDGFELYAKAEQAEALFDVLCAAGEPFGLQLCGLGCRDTLRMEAAMPLYGHEMDDTVTPLETGLGHYVKLDKPSFIGREALLAAGEPKRARIGLKMIGRGIAREHFPVYAGERRIGQTTSGTHCPTVGPVAMALVEAPYQTVGTQLVVEIRGQRVAAEIVPLPFYARKK